MTCKIIIDTERCKGCGLCVEFCTKKGIVISKCSNSSAYFPAEKNDADCTGCAICAVVCPETCIKIFRQSNITPIESKKKNKSSLIKEKV